jgi:hypothetical protein
VVVTRTRDRLSRISLRFGHATTSRDRGKHAANRTRQSYVEQLDLGLTGKAGRSCCFCTAAEVPILSLEIHSVVLYHPQSLQRIRLCR